VSGLYVMSRIGILPSCLFHADAVSALRGANSCVFNAACAAAALQELQVRTADVIMQAQLVQVREVSANVTHRAVICLLD
jgi:hypothetical protein